MLPASPRLLVLQGRKEEALASLAKLRLRPLCEARTDPLIQVRTLDFHFFRRTCPSDSSRKIELLEMEAEAMMLQKTSPIGRGRPLRDEALAWARLFDHRYIDRTLVGVVVMFFQRESRKTFALPSANLLPNRMEWHQCLDILWTIAYAQSGAQWKYYQSIGGWWNKYRPIFGGNPGHLVY